MVKSLKNNHFSLPNHVVKKNIKTAKFLTTLGLTTVLSLSGVTIVPPIVALSQISQTLEMETPNGQRCLDAAAESWTANRGQIQLYNCNGSPNQQWISSPDGSLRINTPNGQRCLDAAAESCTANRGGIQLYNCNGSPNQRWLYF